MKKLFFAPLLFVSLTYASDNLPEEKSYDLNGDGTIDFVELYVSGDIKEQKEDLDFDGNFDRFTSFHHDPGAEFFKVVEQKKTADSPRKRISYRIDPSQKKSISLTQIDSDNDGKWDEEFQTSSDLLQKKDDCDIPGTSSLQSFARSFMKAAHMSDEFTNTKSGYRIHQSCLDNGQKGWFLKNIEQSLSQGLSCLDRLAKAGGMGAAKNKISLINLLQHKKVEVICNENKSIWNPGDIARATTSSQDTTAFLHHPGLSINPEMIDKYKKSDVAGEIEFRKTIFHEQLHNLGILHDHDVEYPYTCETCCFKGEDSQEVKDVACRICSGNYSGPTDFKYIKDMSQFWALKYSQKKALKQSIAFVKENGGSLNGMSYLAFNLSDGFNPVGIYLADKIKKENSPNAEQLKVLEDAQLFKDNPLFKSYEKSAKVIAEVYYKAYKERDPLTAMKLLEKEFNTINRDLKKKDSQKNAEYVQESLKDDIKKIVSDIWINNYTGKSKDENVNKETNDLASKLFNSFHL